MNKIIPILFLIILVSGCIEEGVISESNTVGLQIIVNNTNLSATGERVVNTNYTALTDIELFVYGEGYGANTDLDLELYINGTMVIDTDLHTTAVIHDNDVTLNAIIPKYSVYKVNKSIAVTGVHWVEYKIGGH